MSSDFFDGVYRIADGYEGRSRTHSFSIAPEEIEDDMTDAAIEKVFDEAMMESFAERVEPVAVNRAEFAAWAHDVLAERGRK